MDFSYLLDTNILSDLEILSLDIRSGTEYAAVRRTLTRQGTLSGPNELLMAAHAIAYDLTVASRHLE